MEYPQEYFEDEIREGFYVSGMVKRAWAAQLEILSEIDKVCKKHNIRWFADCGTLLGAVRHGGYVPWDDDLDICMLRDDFTRFNEVAERELPKDYVVLNMHKKEVYYTYLTRVTNGHRLNFDKEYLEKYHDFPYAMGVDIFPLDYLSPDDEIEEERKRRAKVLMMSADSICDENMKFSGVRKTVNDLGRTFNLKFSNNKPIRQQLFEAVEREYTRFPSKGAKHVALMHFWADKNNHKYPIELFDDIICLPFEKTTIPVPARYDEVLKIEYGNYSVINKNGGLHDYPCFSGQEEFLMELLPEYKFKYTFEKGHLIKNEAVKKEHPRKQAEQFLNTMIEANISIVKMLDTEQYEIVFSVLEACQQAAINIGELLEAYYGVDFAPVKCLEEYCELLYQIHVAISEDGQISVDGIRELLVEICETFAAQIETHITERKEIVFMPVKAKDWWALENVWRAAVESGEYDVYVVPLPYHYRDAVGAPGEIMCDRDKFPEYLNATAYDAYDMILHHPDVIVIQNPYDECNYVTTVIPEYYSVNLKRYSGKLVYIPYFKMDELSPENAKGIKTMDFFCTVPGVVHSDVVIVQSEQMREAYIKRLTEFAGEDTEDAWKEKIRSAKDALPDIDLYDNRLKQSHSQDRSHYTDAADKKIILFYIGVSSVLGYMERALDKIECVMETFKSYANNIHVVWRLVPEIAGLLEKKDRRLLERYTSIIEKYKKEDWCTTEDALPVDEQVDLVDAYYGEISAYSRKCEVAGKPAMCMDVTVG